MRRQRRQDVLNRAVLVDVTGDSERRELAHLVGARDRSTEDQNRQGAVIELANGPHELDAGSMRQPEVEDDEIEAREVGTYAREELGRTLDGHGLVPGLFE